MPLVIALDVGDTLVMDEGRVRITVVEKTGRRSKVAVDAPRSVRVTVDRAAPDVAASQPIVGPLTGSRARG